MQVQLTDVQQNRLKVLAGERGTSLSELVREGVDLFLTQAEGHRKWQRAWDAYGCAHEPDGATDVAERHDDYLNRIYARDEDLR